MKNKFTNYLYCFFLLFAIQSVFSCKEVVNDTSVSNSDIINNENQENYASSKNDLVFDYLPSSTTNVVYKHKGYIFSYNEEYEQSEWLAYELEDGDWKYSEFERRLFNQDPLVITESAHWGNYKKSGYTKGHLCPAGDRKQNQELFEETFYTSNVSPQTYEFNAGVWNRLEQKVRYWAGKYDGLYVVTGGVLNDDLEVIGREHVAVPKYFYKVLMTKDQSTMIAFLVPHTNSKQPLYEFTTSVDEIENITGINFFPKLEDAKENKMEANKSYKNWSF